MKEKVICSCGVETSRGNLPNVLTNAFPMARDLKKFVGVKGTDLISIDSIPKIEEKLQNYKINVTGDHTYTSTRNKLQEINLKLHNEHFTLDKPKLKKSYGYSYKERKPLIYGKKDVKNMYKVFDGEKSDK